MGGCCEAVGAGIVVVEELPMVLGSCVYGGPSARMSATRSRPAATELFLQHIIIIYII